MYLYRYINGIVLFLESYACGIDLQDEKISILLDADDVVNFADNQNHKRACTSLAYQTFSFERSR